MKSCLSTHLNQRKLSTLIENRSIYQSDYAELNIFETHQIAEKVALKFNFPVIASMIQGKKVMHLDGMPDFEFYPGESVVLPTDKKMVIDFPEATLENPTRCLALGIDKDKIEEVSHYFNRQTVIENENNDWSISRDTSYLLHDQGVNELIKRLVHTFTANAESKDILLDLMIQELIVRLLQSKAKAAILHDEKNMFTDTRIGYVLKYIQENLTDKTINIDTLAQKACMSSSHFHLKFKNTLGISPIDYINAEKIKFSKKLMKERKNLNISEVAYLSGFNSISYFNRQFKKMELVTPKAFKSSLRS